MGAKTWMLVYSDKHPRDVLGAHPELDRDASLRLATKLFPNGRLIPAADVTLLDTDPRGGAIHVAQYPGVAIVAAEDFAGDYPSKVATRFLEHGKGGNITLHAMHSVVDFFAYARWQNGKLVRSLSVAPDNGIIEDIGKALPFEEPYWAGKYPAVDPEEDEASKYPLPFHPLEMAETALAHFFGFQLEGASDDSAKEVTFQPESVALLRFERASWWQFWK